MSVGASHALLMAESGEESLVVLGPGASWARGILINCCHLVHFLCIGGLFACLFCVCGMPVVQVAWV